MIDYYKVSRMTATRPRRLIEQQTHATLLAALSDFKRPARPRS